MDGKDPDAGMLPGHAAVGLETRGQRKLPVLLLTHSVLTCACAAICIYTLYKEAWRQTPQPVDKGIYLNMKKVNFDTSLLNFTVTWNNSLMLEHGSEVMVPLAGPYIFYICAFVSGDHDGKGNLTLSQGLTTIFTELSVTPGKKCVRHQKVISLYYNEKVTFRFNNTLEPNLNLDDLRVGLHYLLGAINFKPPEID